jgi:antitoxin (DNA-binding transcriptional repressor) of toxin-antitoxin stability system
MKFITVRDMRTTPAAIWKQLPKDRERIIKNNGRPIALLTPINDTNLEETLKALRRVHAAQAVAAMQVRSKELGNDRLTEEEIDAEIRSSRADR